MTIAPNLLTGLATAAEEVFTTMVFRPLVRVPATSDRPGGHESGVVASVAFAGHRRGIVSIHSSIEAAREIAGSMLGIPGEFLNGEVADAMGEVANMVAGTFRNKLAAVEPRSEIAVPTVTVGSDFTMKYSQTVRWSQCAFEMKGHQVSVDLVLIGEEPAPSCPI
jgi:chemotaxis protein CheX